MPTANEIFRNKMEALAKAEQLLDKRVKSVQSKLYQLLISEYLIKFEVKDGVLLNTLENIALIAQMDRYFDKVQKALNRDVLGYFATSLIDSSVLTAEYYVALGFKKTVVNSILKNKVFLEQRIGITPTGRLRKNSYLYRLGETRQVRQQLKDYVLRNLTGDVSYLDFQLGLRNLVIGNKKQKGLATKGSLQKYFDQYAYDTFNEMDAVANNQIAQGLQLEHFIYEGSLITTSRKFCAKRAGKAFTVKETKNWKNDADLIDKKTKDTYRPLIDRGRYRCRHFIKYITKELYDAIKNN